MFLVPGMVPKTRLHQPFLQGIFGLEVIGGRVDHDLRGFQSLALPFETTVNAPLHDALSLGLQFRLEIRLLLLFRDGYGEWDQAEATTPCLIDTLQGGFIVAADDQ